MKNRILFISFVFILANAKLLCSFAMSPEIKIIRDRQTASDSSFYDLLKLNEQTFLLAGKFGILQTLDREGNIKSIFNPEAGKDIYKIDKWDDENIIACSDKGYILQYNLKTKIWNNMQLKGFENSCMYSMCVVDENTAYVCGGRSEIAHSLKVIPNGFILFTKDRGRTWEKIYSCNYQMVWSLSVDKKNNKINALVYQPNKSFIYSSNIGEQNFTKNIALGKGLYHELDYDNNNNWIAVGGRHNGFGISKNALKKCQYNSGLIWSYSVKKNIEIYSGSSSNFIIKDTKESTEKQYSLPLNNNYGIYESAFFDDKKAVLVGSGQCIIFVDFKD